VSGDSFEGSAGRDDAHAACTCDGPLRNVNVDGNAGHAPGCPRNPNTWPEGLRVCDGCGIPFSEPVTPEHALSVFPSLDVASFICEACDVC
jgi:hypothetical protein